MTGNLKDIVRGMGGEWIVSFTTRDNPVAMFYRLKDHEVSIEIKRACQEKFEELYSHEEFMEIFGKSYL